MLRYGQFEAWLQLEDTTYVNEYMTQVNGNEVSCIVGSTYKIPFSVHWRDNGSRLFTAGYIVVDGVKASGRFLHGTGQTYRGGFRKGPTTEEPFTFTRENGTIQLILTLVEDGEVRPPDDTRAGLAKRDQMFAAQGLEYRPIYGYNTMTVPQQHEATYSVSGTSGKSGEVVVTFTFNYRGVGWMAANGISRMRPNTPPLPITIWNSREHGTQHGGEWPAARVPEPEPKESFSTEDGRQRAGELRKKYKKELDAAMIEKYGHPAYDSDDPSTAIPEKTVKPKPRKPRKLKEKPEIPEEGRVYVEHTLPLPQEPPPQRGMRGYVPPPKQPRARPQPQVQAQPQPQEQAPAQAENVQAEKPKERINFDGVAAIAEYLKTHRQEFRDGMAERYGPDWEKPEPPRTYRKRKSTVNVRATAVDKGKAPEAEMLRRAKSQSKLVSRPADMQQHPRASNTYILPSPAPSSSSSASTPRIPFDAGHPASYSMQPPPYPYLTPSGRPSAVIDTRFLGYASPAPSEASTSSGRRSGQAARR